MTPARWLSLALLALAALTVARQKLDTGVQLEALQLLVLCGPGHLARLSGLEHGRRLWALGLLEAVAWLGMPTVAGGGIPLLLGSLALSLRLRSPPESPDDPASPRDSWETATTAACLCLALTTVGVGLVRWPELPAPWLPGALLLLATGERFDPRRVPGPGARLAALAGCVLVFAWTFSRNTPLPPLPPLTTVGLVSPDPLFVDLAALAAGSLVLARGYGIAARWLPRRRLRRLTFAVLTPALALGLLWGLGELAVQLLPNPVRRHYGSLVLPTPDDHLSWHAPHETWTFRGPYLKPANPEPNPVRWNALGFHDLDHALEKPAGTRRVVVLGDSFVEGVAVTTSELFHLRLQHHLQAAGVAAEAISLGRSGWGQVEELQALREHGLDFGPDVVLLAFTPGNDVRNNLPELEQAANTQVNASTWARSVYLRALQQRLWFTAAVADGLDRLAGTVFSRRAVDFDVYVSEPAERAELWDAAWTRTEELLGELQQASAGAGARFGVVIFPSSSELLGTELPGGDLGLPARRLGEICQRRGIPCFDLAEGLRSGRALEAQQQLYLLPHDGHFSAAGHDAAASLSASLLLEQQVLSRRTQ